MKKITCVLLFLVLTSVLFACGGPSAQETSGAAAQPYDTVEETAPETTAPETERAAVREIDCVRGNIKNGIFEVCCAPSGLIALQDGATDCRFLVVDGEKDVLLAEYDRKESDDLLVGVSGDGEVIAVNYTDGTLRVFSEDGVREVVPDADIGDYMPQFDPDTGRLYGFRGGELISIGLDGSVRSELVFPRDVILLCVETVKRIALSVSGGENDALQSVLALTDYAGNEFCSFDADVASATFDDEYVAVTNTYYHPDGDSETHVRRFSSEDGEYISGFSFPGDCEFRFGSDTRYAYSISFEDFERCYLRFVDASCGMEAELSGVAGIGGFFLNIASEYSYPDDRVVFGTTDGEGKSHVLIVDPSMLTYSSGVKALDAYETPAAHTLDAGLSSARSFADSLEEKYGVRILIGDEVYSAAPQGEYSVVSTTSGEGGLSGSREISDVRDMLTTVDISLSRYPDGFTRRFINSRGKGGLRFILVRDLVNEQNERFTAAGLQYSTGAWHNVVLDVDSIDEGSVHHELWHASEVLIRRLTDGVDENEWEALDPEGFTYHYDFDSYTDADVMNYVLYSSDDPYFTKIYSVVTPHEDRATLIEEALRYVGNTMKRNEVLYSYPHLTAKLDYLARLSEECFGYVYWEKMTGE